MQAKLEAVEARTSILGMPSAITSIQSTTPRLGLEARGPYLATACHAPGDEKSGQANDVRALQFITQLTLGRNGKG